MTTTEDSRYSTDNDDNNDNNNDEDNSNDGADVDTEDDHHLRHPSSSLAK